MRSIEKLKMALELAYDAACENGTESLLLTVGDKLREPIQVMRRFIDEYAEGDTIRVERRKKDGRKDPRELNVDIPRQTFELSCKEKVDLLMTRTDNHFSEIESLKNDLSYLKTRVYALESKERWWKPDWWNTPTCGVPANDVQTSMSSRSMAQAQMPADLRNQEPQTDAIPDMPPEREA